MTKIADCIEHGTLHKGWVRISKVKVSSARMLARHSIKVEKKFHGMVHAHQYNYPSYLDGMVFGIGTRQLLNKGGKP